MLEDSTFQRSNSNLFFWNKTEAKRQFFKALIFVSVSEKVSELSVKNDSCKGDCHKE